MKQGQRIAGRARGVVLEQYQLTDPEKIESDEVDATGLTARVISHRLVNVVELQHHPVRRRVDPESPRSSDQAVEGRLVLVPGLQVEDDD